MSTSNHHRKTLTLFQGWLQKEKKFICLHSSVDLAHCDWGLREQIFNSVGGGGGSQKNIVSDTENTQLPFMSNGNNSTLPYCHFYLPERTHTHTHISPIWWRNIAIFNWFELRTSTPSTDSHPSTLVLSFWPKFFGQNYRYWNTFHSH